MPSTVIETISYDAATSRLRIIFLSGAVYDYIKVPEKVFADMKKVSSKGIFFNKHIKDNYTFERIS